MATCPNCGGTISKRARYCSACGVPLRASGGVQPRYIAARTAEQSEVCAIGWWHGYVRSDFYAASIAADGRERDVARSPRFSWWRGDPPPPLHEGARAAHDALVARLVENGWRSLGAASGPWYAVRFQRRTSALRALSGPPDADDYGEGSGSDTALS